MLLAVVLLKNPSIIKHTTSIVIDPMGNIINTYRKIHLFDVELHSINIQESRHFWLGNQITTVSVEDYSIFVMICGFQNCIVITLNIVEIITIPASFTYKPVKTLLPLCQ